MVRDIVPYRWSIDKFCGFLFPNTILKNAFVSFTRFAPFPKSVCNLPQAFKKGGPGDLEFKTTRNYFKAI